MKFQNNSGDKVEEKEDGTLHSQFMSDAERIKQKLDSVSPSLCLAKWQQVSLHLTTGHNNSCYHPPLHRSELSETDPSSLHNTYWKREQRKRMLNGERPEECSYCWKIEDTGNLSDRHYRSGEPWAAEKFVDITTQDPMTANVIPAYVEVNFSNICNLKCSYCSPQFSSSWAQEVKQLGAYPTSNRHNSPEYFEGERAVIPNREHNPYVEQFWRWWPELYPQLKHFRMTGGEPTMDKNTYKVFDWVLANPKKDLHLNTTSNFSQEKVVFDKYLDYVKQMCEGECVEHFMQFVSVDGWGKQAEYMRNGLDFDLMKTNVERYLEEVPYRNSITFIITMNNLSVTSVQQLLIWITELREKYSTTYQRVWFDTPILRQPKWQELNILPKSYAWKLQRIVDWMKPQQETDATRFKGFKDYEVQRLQRVVDYMNANPRDDKTVLADFWRFFEEHDKRRGTNLTETFPEMMDWILECKYWAENEIKA